MPLAGCPSGRREGAECKPVTPASPEPCCWSAGGPRPCGTSREPDSGHAGTTSVTVHVRPTSRNAMKPRIQGVLTQWIPGFSASGRRPAGVRQRVGRASGSRPVRLGKVLREGLVHGRWLEECLGVPFRSSRVTDDVENGVRVWDVERSLRLPMLRAQGRSSASACSSPLRSPGCHRLTRST